MSFAPVFTGYVGDERGVPLRLRDAVELISEDCDRGQIVGIESAERVLVQWDDGETDYWPANCLRLIGGDS